MIALLVQIIIVCVVLGLLFYLVGMLPMPEPWPTIIRVCVILICILVLLSIAFGGGGYLPALNFRR